MMQSSITEVFSCIDSCYSIELALCRKTNFIGHTGISLGFDGEEPQFTIDFGTSLAYRNPCENAGTLVQQPSQIASATSFSGVEGGVSINGFNRITTSVIHDIRSFSIVSQQRKRDVKKLIDSLMKIAMGEYHVWRNNCRSYVIEAYKLITGYGCNPDDFEDPDTVETCLKGADDLEYSLRSQRDFDEQMKKIKQEDLERLALVGIGALGLAAGVGALAYGVAKAIGGRSRNRNESE